jgi:hypothetical protein
MPRRYADQVSRHSSQSAIAGHQWRSSRVFVPIARGKHDLDAVGGQPASDVRA